MSEFDKTEYDGDTNRDDIARLIRYAGARETVADQRFAKAHGRVNEHWQKVISARRRQRQLRLVRQFAVAASLLVVVGVTLVTWRGALPPTGNDALLVNRVIGDVRIDGVRAQAGDPVAADSVIETPSGGRVALQLPDGKSLRLDNSSTVIVADAGNIELDRGAVYIDSGAEQNKAPVYVTTRFGVASDIGTQFQVRVDDERLRVGVREGLVEISRGDAETVPVRSGTMLEIAADGAPRERNIAGDDSVWNWVTTITPEFDIRDATLEEYLSWYARQRGVSLEWRDATSQGNARNIRLSGSIANMSLDEGFSFVRRIAPFDYEVTDHALRVSVD